jgi:hypothetical protein
MLYSQRTEFTYDPALGTIGDTALALRVADEYHRVHSARPYPFFFEVQREPESIDEIWHMPKSVRTKYSRRLEIYGINQFQKTNWAVTKFGITNQRRDTFWLSNLALQRIDYFPLRGDGVYWNGFRYIIIEVSLPPTAYWGQTNVWTGLTVDAIIPADGDALPAFPKSQLSPAEKSKVGNG